MTVERRCFRLLTPVAKSYFWISFKSWITRASLLPIWKAFWVLNLLVVSSLSVAAVYAQISLTGKQPIWIPKHVLVSISIWFWDPLRIKRSSPCRPSRVQVFPIVEYHKWKVNWWGQNCIQNQDCSLKSPLLTQRDRGKWSPLVVSALSYSWTTRHLWLWRS